MNKQVTQNIYKSWNETLGTGLGSKKPLALRPLHVLNLDELGHIKWLMEQEIESRKADNSRSENEKINK